MYFMKVYHPSLLKLDILLYISSLAILFGIYYFSFIHFSIIFLIISVLLIPLMVYSLVSRRTRYALSPKIEIYDDKIISENLLTKKRHTFTKQDIKEFKELKVLNAIMYGAVLKNPKKYIISITQDNIDILSKILEWFILRKEYSFKDIFSNDKRLLQKRKMKAIEYNYNKYGIHNYILANYYKNKVQLLSDLKNFLKHKNKK